MRVMVAFWIWMVWENGKALAAWRFVVLSILLFIPSCVFSSGFV